MSYLISLLLYVVFAIFLLGSFLIIDKINFRKTQKEIQKRTKTEIERAKAEADMLIAQIKNSAEN